MLTQRPMPSLKDPELEEQLWEKGYVVVPFFDEKTVEEVFQFCRKYTTMNSTLDRDEVGKMYASTHSPDIAYKLAMNDRIMSFYRPFVEKYFIDPLIMGGSFILKPVGKGVSHPHLDWSLVEEGPFRSCNCWVPLIDLHDDNGIIEVLPGSHRLYPTYRGPNIPDTTNDLQQFYWDTMIKLYMKAGEALIYDHRLIHGSKDNMSNIPRPATACAVTNKKAALRLYYLDKEKNKVEAFAGENTMHLISNERFEKPATMESLGYIEDYEVKQIKLSDYDFLNLNYQEKVEPTTVATETTTEQIGNKKLGLWEKVKSIFS